MDIELLHEQQEHRLERAEDVALGRLLAKYRQSPEALVNDAVLQALPHVADSNADYDWHVKMAEQWLEAYERHGYFAAVKSVRPHLHTIIDNFVSDQVARMANDIVLSEDDF